MQEHSDISRAETRMLFLDNTKYFFNFMRYLEQRLRRIWKQIITHFYV